MSSNHPSNPETFSTYPRIVTSTSTYQDGIMLHVPPSVNVTPSVGLVMQSAPENKKMLAPSTIDLQDFSLHSTSGFTPLTTDLHTLEGTVGGATSSHTSYFYNSNGTTVPLNASNMLQLKDGQGLITYTPVTAAPVNEHSSSVEHLVVSTKAITTSPATGNIHNTDNPLEESCSEGVLLFASQVHATAVDLNTALQNKIKTSTTAKEQIKLRQQKNKKELAESLRDSTDQLVSHMHQQSEQFLLKAQRLRSQAAQLQGQADSISKEAERLEKQSDELNYRASLLMKQVEGLPCSGPQNDEDRLENIRQIKKELLENIVDEVTVDMVPHSADKSSGNGLESGTVIVHTPNCDDLVAAAHIHNPTAIHLGHHTNMQREEVVTSEHLEQLNQIRAQHMIQQSEMHSNEQHSNQLTQSHSVEQLHEMETECTEAPQDNIPGTVSSEPPGAIPHDHTPGSTAEPPGGTSEQPLNTYVTSDPSVGVIDQQAAVDSQAYSNVLNVSVNDAQCVVQGDGSKRWQCLDCAKSYTTKHNLIIHMMGHRGIKPHCCLLCGKLFKQLSHLQTHMLIHANTKPHICNVCNKAFTQASHMKRHMSIHMDRRPYACTKCDKGFSYPSELRVHMERHSHKEDGTCKVCGLVFANAKRLKLHMLQSHKRITDLTCNHCGRVFTYPSQLKEHLLTHSDTRPYVCSDCGMDFVKEHHLKAHQFTHTGLRPWVCEVCNRSFNQKANMVRHLLIHSERRQYNCQMCEKSFSQPQTLKAHMVVHAEQKPFQCQICRKEFSRLHNLQGHLHIHKNSRPHVCFCGSSFTLRGNLQRHKKDKHGISITSGANPTASAPGGEEQSTVEAAYILNSLSSKETIPESQTPGEETEVEEGVQEDQSHAVLQPVDQSHSCLAAGDQHHPGLASGDQQHAAMQPGDQHHTSLPPGVHVVPVIRGGVVTTDPSNTNAGSSGMLQIIPSGTYVVPSHPGSTHVVTTQLGGNHVVTTDPNATHIVPSHTDSSHLIGTHPDGTHLVALDPTHPTSTNSSHIVTLQANGLPVDPGGLPGQHVVVANPHDIPAGVRVSLAPAGSLVGTQAVAQPTGQVVSIDPTTQTWYAMKEERTT